MSSNERGQACQGMGAAVSDRAMTKEERTEDMWAGLVFLVGLVIFCCGLGAGFALWGGA
jgi:hypothetical protein